MADYSIAPDTLPDTSSGLNAMLAANSGGSSAPKKQKSDSVGANWTAENTKAAEEALSKYKTKETERENTPLPTPPKMEEGPKAEDYQTSSMQKFGSAGMVLATLGSLLSRKSLTNALNSGAAVNTAINEGDAANFKSALDKWKVDNDNAWKMADWQQKHYDDIMQRIDAGEKGAETELKLKAVEFQNPTLENAIRVQDYKNLVQAYAKNLKELKESAQDSKSLFDSYQGKLEDFQTKNGRPAGKQEAASFWNESKEEAKGGGDFAKTQLGNDKKDAYKKAYQKELAASGDESKARLAGESASGDVENASKGKLDAGLTEEKYNTYKSDPAMQVALRAYMLSGDARTALGGGVFGGKSLLPKIEALQRMAYEKDPSFNPAIAKAKFAGFSKELGTVSLSSGKIQLASNILESSLPSLIESADKVGLSNVRGVNAIFNAAKNQMNDSDFKNFQTQLRAVATDYGQFIGRTSGTVHSDEEALRILNEGMSEQSLKGFADAVAKERDNVLSGINRTLSEIESRMGGKSNSTSEAPEGTVVHNGDVTMVKKDGKWVTQ